MMGEAFPNTISRTAAVTAPALMVLAVILFMGKVSGAHLSGGGRAGSGAAQGALFTEVVDPNKD